MHSTHETPALIFDTLHLSIYLNHQRNQLLFMIIQLSYYAIVPSPSWQNLTHRLIAVTITTTNKPIYIQSLQMILHWHLHSKLILIILSLILKFAVVSHIILILI